MHSRMLHLASRIDIAIVWGGGASAKRAPKIGEQSRASMQRGGGVAIGLACRGSSSNILEFLLEFISGSLSSRGRGIDGTSGPADASRGHTSRRLSLSEGCGSSSTDNTFLARCSLARRRRSYINIARKTCGRVRQTRAEDPPARLIARWECFRDSGDCAVAFSFAIRRSLARPQRIILSLR